MSNVIVLCIFHILNYFFREEEGIEMQVLGRGVSTDGNEPSTSGVAYHRNDPSKMCNLNNLFKKLNTCY